LESIEFELSIQDTPTNVFQTTHDYLPDIVSYVSIVEHKGRTSRELSDSEFETVDVWEVDAMKAFPNFISSLISIQKVTLETEIQWYPEDNETDWKFTAPNISGLLDNCEGKALFFETEEGTRIELAGEFELDLSAISGVPWFLASTLKGQQGRIAEKVINRYTDEIEEHIESLGGNEDD
jgi:hypothetical protein